MLKSYCLLCFLCFTNACFPQIKDTFYGVGITRIEHEASVKDTSRLLYIRNTAGNRLSVYTVSDGVVSEASAYRLSATKQGLFLYNEPLLVGQLQKDSLSITFNDKAHAIIINRTDRYVLFPAYYGRFKQEVLVRHSIMSLLSLLSDAIGDYPISATLPLVNLTPVFDQHIDQATIVTQRSQADLKDTWTCKYAYNAHHQLKSIKANSPEEIRFTKMVDYSKPNVISVLSYLNIEDRQVTNRTVEYASKNRNLVKSKERVFESGKNRESVSSVILNSHDLGKLQKMDLSTAEVLKISNYSKLVIAN
jgi:hypothetical protein